MRDDSPIGTAYAAVAAGKCSHIVFFLLPLVDSEAMHSGDCNVIRLFPHRNTEFRFFVALQDKNTTNGLRRAHDRANLRDFVIALEMKGLAPARVRRSAFTASLASVSKPA